ncbi:allantoate amidohydrolase [Nocardioides sp. Bht2]|uniref:allantoate amidohydrolase n=1 Tax=Nocardioides sp. Bht2 TaxID=3392297 RepID=UPI0039B61680
MGWEQMWRDLAPVGLAAVGGGYRREGFGTAERELQAWFLEEARNRGLEIEQDAIGNTVAWWRPDGATGRGVLTGSHLDSVPDGGAFDGPLGVVSAFAALDLIRENGTLPARPLGIAVFVEEEGSRFGLPCLGSRWAVGALDEGAATVLRDRAGTGLVDVLDQHGLGLAPSTLLDDVAVFVELHVEQGRELALLDAPVGVASGIWPHGRYRFDFTGQANHAGTTAMDERHDPMLTFAMTALAANKQARLGGQRATFGRVELEPGSTNAVPRQVRAWLDARAATEEALADLVDAVLRQGRERAARDGTVLELTTESHSGLVQFDPDLVQRVAARPTGRLPVLATQAGHDAGVLASVGIATAMLFVRNPTGISHAPEEFAETADALVGVETLAQTLLAMAGTHR